MKEKIIISFDVYGYLVENLYQMYKKATEKLHKNGKILLFGGEL